MSAEEPDNIELIPMTAAVLHDEAFHQLQKTVENAASEKRTLYRRFACTVYRWNSLREVVGRLRSLVALLSHMVAEKNSIIGRGAPALNDALEYDDLLAVGYWFDKDSKRTITVGAEVKAEIELMKAASIVSCLPR
jgi:hypothetical protein